MYGIKILISGDYALFTRPEMKVERVSYDVPTPSALIGLISNVYWHPGVKYVIDKIYVINPIEFINIRRNEVKSKISESGVMGKIKNPEKDISIYTSEDRTQRASLILKNVCYGVEAHFEICGDNEENMTKEKCFNILLRRLKKGQHFSQPSLGCREFPAMVELCEEFPQSKLQGEVDLGYMLYDMQFQPASKKIDYSNDANPRFYRPKMIDGMIDVAKYAKEILC